MPNDYLTSEYLGLPCTVARLSKTARILLPSQGLVKSNPKALADKGMSQRMATSRFKNSRP